MRKLLKLIAYSLLGQANILCFFSCQPEQQRILVGTYTSGNSEGIYLGSFNGGEGTLTLEGVVAKTQNPSFLAVTDNGQYVFAVGETSGGTVTAFQWEGAQLRQIGQRPTGGAGPCHVDISPDQRFVAVANYSGGNFSVLTKNDNGELDLEIATIQHSGRSVDSTRQQGPHAHCVKWIGERVLLVVDLGIDRIIPYRIDESGQVVALNQGIKMQGGCGPRHVVAHPGKDILYATCELSNEMAVMNMNPENYELEVLQYISTLPENFTEFSKNADLHLTPDGRYLYASNRGHESLAAFKVLEDGKLESVGYFPVRGKHPRNFMIMPDGRHLLVANMNSNNIVVFRINATDGSLEFTGSEIEVPMPVCLKVLP